MGPRAAILDGFILYLERCYNPDKILKAVLGFQCSRPLNSLAVFNQPSYFSSSGLLGSISVLTVFMAFSCFSKFILCIYFAYMGPKYLSNKTWEAIFFIKGMYQSQQCKNKRILHLIDNYYNICFSYKADTLKTIRISNSRTVWGPLIGSVA